MERKIRKFKRKYKKENYGKEFKNEMNILNFKKKSYNPVESEIKCEIVKRGKFSKKLKTLPKEIQRKIYIFAMKKHWRYMMEIKSLKPMWCNYKKYVDNEIKKSVIDNVHFMHLEFNTLPEYKQWIPGCQCDYCNLHHKTKVEEYEQIVNNPDYFNELIHCNDTTNYWNQNILYFTIFSVIVTEDEGILISNTSSIRIYDPLKGYLWTIYDQIQLSPHESPIYFSNEVLHNPGDIYF